ncbi:RDD family protein [Actinoplanes sp. NPDC051851]|uniref:RDD family protein n=1 Tax=Actinoplanes sp. NPDC051851 TaxID=3154753 RepID=UPI00342BCDFB
MVFVAPSLNVRVTGRRVVATVIDGMVFGALNSGLAALFGTEKADSGFDLTQLSVNKGTIWLPIAAILYYVLLEGFFGRTLGKLLTGIRVVDAETGGRPGVLAAVSRTLLRLIDGFGGYLVGFLVAINSDRRRRLGDMAAKTLVVRA